MIDERLRLRTRIEALARVVGGRVSVHVDAPVGYTTFLFFFTGRSGLQRLVVSSDGDVVEEGHEGSSTLSSTTLPCLDPEHSLAVLRRVHDDLERDALSAEERLLEREARRMRTERARKNLEVRLGTKT